MKKVIVLIAFCILLTGCGNEFQIYGKNIELNESKEFRHIQYRTSDSFDYGSDGEYRFYNLYDKKHNVIYSVSIEKLKGSYQTNLKEIEAEPLNKNIKDSSVSIKRLKWQKVTYQKDKKTYNVYYVPYNKNEYYKIEFYNSIDKTEDFEKAFLSYVRLK